uniref:Uncharacterized protein n=1 Tax=Utricularia reniformis TaxID=192314 RepID=A0A1Y0B156_9LAMI|nr:hypothetical protein AEK19_MT0883 [Utricularia reniformis]ART31114.1 hypothetical protein AEK19_MT0883 [Utricularia reniformis]
MLEKLTFLCPLPNGRAFSHPLPPLPPRPPLLPRLFL